MSWLDSEGCVGFFMFCIFVGIILLIPAIILSFNNDMLPNETTALYILTGMGCFFWLIALIIFCCWIIEDKIEKYRQYKLEQLGEIYY